MASAHSKKKYKSKLYLLPLFVLVLNQSINIVSKRKVNVLAFEDDSSQLIVRGVAYGIALILFFIHTKENFSLLKARILFWLLSFYILASMIWSSFPVKVFINWGHLMGMVLVILAARIYISKQPEKLFPILSIFFAFSMFLSLCFVIAFPAIGINQDGRWQGIAGNANTLGILAISSIWASLSAIYKKSGKTWFFYLILIMSTVTMLGSGSKTSLIVSVFILLCTHLLVTQESSSNLKRFLILALWGFASLVLLLMVVILMPEILGIEGAMDALGRDTTFSGRTIVWEHAWKLFLAKPVHGWGFDSTMSVLKYTGGRLGQFHNGYLDLLVRGGLLGLGISGMIIISLIKRLTSTRSTDARSSVLFLSMVLAILVHNISEASLVRGTHLFWLIIMIGYLSVDSYKYMRK